MMDITVRRTTVQCVGGAYADGELLIIIITISLHRAISHDRNPSIHHLLPASALLGEHGIFMWKPFFTVTTVIASRDTYFANI